MKRHALRPGLNTLTLSLLSSLTLLTACGGGGKDAPAAAAPSSDKGSEPVKPPPAPTAADFSSADEPYFVAESSVRLDGKPPVYRLNIIDGRSQKAIEGQTFESSTPFTDQWTVTQKSTVSQVDVKEDILNDKGVKVDEKIVGRYYVDKLVGNGALVLIKDHKLFEIDLSRGSAFTQMPLSPSTVACSITGSHSITRDGSAAAVFVMTAGDDGSCSNASDNVVRIVKTGETTDGARAKSYLPLIKPSQIVRFIYDSGALTGVLAQDGLDSGTTQLKVYSPTLSEVISTSPILIGSTGTYETSASNAKLGVEWIADAPGEVGAGYLRLQQYDAVEEKYSNKMFEFKWNPTTKVATTSAEPIVGLLPGALSNKGTNDHKHVYFTNGDRVVYGPTGNADEPFTDLMRIESITDKMASAKIYISHQSTDYVVVRAEGSLEAAYSVNKNPNVNTTALVTLFENGGTKQPQTPIGMWHKVTTANSVETRTPYLITQQRNLDYDDQEPNAYSLKRINLSTGENMAEWIDGVNKMNILSRVWSQQSINGQRELVSAIVCPRTPGINGSKGNCSSNGDEMKTVDFAKKSFGIVLSTISTSGKITSVKAGDVYQGINASLNITRYLRSLDYYEDPWFFNTQLANGLKLVTTPYKKP